MIKLIRNCSHNNEVATFYFEKNQEKAIIKVSSTQPGIEEIKQEVEGWRWYQSRRYPNSKKELCEIIDRKKNYIKIKIQYIEGCKEEYSKGIQKNAVLTTNIIQHYCDIWQGDKENTHPCHGDLSIVNVISNKDGIHIIDWEHFSLNGTPPFGFDAYNLLFEQLWFSMKKGKERKYPNNGERDILLDNIRIIRAASTEFSEFHARPLFSVQKFIRTNPKLWKDQNYRFPVLLFDKEEIAIIDDMIRAHI